MITESIVEILQSKGHYHRVPRPLHIVDVNFEFDAVMVGPENQRGLILILSAEDVPLDSVRRRVDTFSEALKITRSMRPITLVLIRQKSDNADNFDNSAIVALEKLGRVILVDPDKPLEASLHSLLSLNPPSTREPVESADDALRAELGNDSEDPVIRKLLKAAQKGRIDVERTLLEEIDRLAGF